MKDVIEFGVMGCAAIAARSTIPAIQGLDGARVRTVASRDPRKAKRYADRFGIEHATDYQGLLDDPKIKAIYMPLPTGLHLQWGLAALQAGKHVLFEKSLAASLEDAQRIVQAAQQHGLLVDENYMFAHHPQQDVVRRALIDLGPLRSFSAFFGFPPLGPENFRYDPGLGGGALLDAGGYVLKALSVLFPRHRSRILSSFTDVKNGVDITGSVCALLEHDGQSIPANLIYGFDHEYRCGIEVWGAKGLLTTDRSFTAGADFQPQMRVRSNGVERTVDLPKGDHFTLKLEAFCSDMDKPERHKQIYDDLLTQATLQQQVRDGFQ
jgi:dTDP-3,4-didehydro-2,6-dideoxy-alpha-D-glucose 3-reductase